VKVTGYKIRTAIKFWELKLSASRAAFENSKQAFPGAKHDDPLKLGDDVARCEANIAALQTHQSLYNSEVHVMIAGVKMPLTYAIKAVGGAGRIEKMWHNVARGPDKRNRYNDDRMQKDEIRAEPTIPADVAISKASEAAKYAAEIRAAIAEGNSVEIEKDIPAELLRS
jgi:hypothetical protein